MQITSGEIVNVLNRAGEDRFYMNGVDVHGVPQLFSIIGGQETVDKLIAGEFGPQDAHLGVYHGEDAEGREYTSYWVNFRKVSSVGNAW